MAKRRSAPFLTFVAATLFIVSFTLLASDFLGDFKADSLLGGVRKMANNFGFHTNLFSASEKNILEKGNENDVFECKIDNVEDEELLEYYKAYFSLPENVRNAFENDHGKIYITSIEEENYESNADGCFFWKFKDGVDPNYADLSTDVEFPYIMCFHEQIVSSYHSLGDVVVHEMGHYVDYKTDYKYTQSDFWKKALANETIDSVFSKNYISDSWKLDVDGIKESEMFADLYTYKGDDLEIVEEAVPGMREYVEEAWKEVK